jgi:hypothetical protein
MNIEFENFFNIRIQEFYPYVTEILQEDFGYQFHNSIIDIDDRKRVEIWRAKKQELDGALVWIELVKDGEDVPIVVGTDILRTMNEYSLEKLFFFTNGMVNDDVLDIIKGENHIIFTPEDIIEAVSLISSKNTEDTEPKPVRKNVKVPSGFILLRNYLNDNKSSKTKIHISIGKIQDIVNDILSQLKDILNFIENIEDLDNLNEEEQKRIKKLQFGLLPELIKTSSFIFNDKFMYVRDELFNSIKECIIFLGAIVEMESMEIIKKHKQQMLDSISVLENVGNELEKYKQELHVKANNYSLNLFVFSLIIIIVTVIIGIIIY